MKYRDVFFDLDGTLTDPAEGITNSVAHALRRMGMEVPPVEELYRYIGPPLTYGFVTYAGVAEADAPRAVELYREHFAEKGLFENRVYDGVPEMLRRITEAGSRVFVATSKPTVFAERILRHFGLDGYFSGIVGSELDGKRVDKGEVIRYLLEEYSVDPAAAVMVGDRKFDITGGIAEGLSVIGVTYGYGSREELLAAGAELLAHSPAEVAELVIG